MAYDLYPAVDENYDFPPEVRAALAKTMELRQVATQMTNIERNNLTGADLWDGRLILNSTIDRVQRYDAASATWQSLAEETDAIVGMTEASRDNLSGVGLFDGRVIYNTTSKRLNRYDSGTSTWRIVGEITDSVVPSANGEAYTGASTEAARADHVHPGSGAVIEEVFTTSGTWNKPADAKTVEIYVVAGGGSGGLSSGGAGYSAGGGGGGGSISLTFDATELPSSVPVTVGSGGAAITTSNTHGLDGGSSSFGDYEVSGGSGGLWSSSTGNGGAGGGVDGGVAGSSSSVPWYEGGPSYHGGGGGAAGHNTFGNGGHSVYGGGGGAGAKQDGNPSGVFGGSSYKAGRGGNSGHYMYRSVENGSIPGGGGGGGVGTPASGAGARGQVVVVTYL